jgi:hypothetical protein
MQYKITIGRRLDDSGGKPRQPQSKLQIVKLWILTLLGLSLIVGIFFVAVIIGSAIASVLLILIALSLLVFVIRSLLKMFARKLR